MNDTSRLPAAAERGLVAVALLLVVVGGAVCIQPACFPNGDQRLVKQIAAALEARHKSSYPLALEYLKRPASGPLGIALAADAAAICFEDEAAIALYQKLPKEGSYWEFRASMGIARRCEMLGRITDSERYLRRALELDPYDTSANSQLGHLLQVTGRNWEAIPCFFTLIRRGKCRGDELLGIAAPERFLRTDKRLIGAGLDASPPDPLSRLATVRQAIYENRQAEAESLLREIIEVAPQLGEAQGRLGRIIYDRGDPVEFQKWRDQLPREARNHPEVWFVQGMQARRLGQVEGAVRCFLEALNLSPNHLGATIQISGCLDQLNRPANAKEFVRHGEFLGNLESQLNHARDEVETATMKKVVVSLAEIGRFWEAAGWAFVISHLPNVSREDSLKEMQQFLALALSEPAQNSVRFNPAAKLRVADFAEPRWDQTGSGKPVLEPAESNTTEWKFRDDARKMGIPFRYYEGTTEKTRLQHIFNVVGGGLAATDYDLDGWCDLYLAQANNWLDKSPQPDYPDRLFRNVPGEPFQEVTVPAGLGDLSFTHGVTAGDFDQDGFPDLYLSNLGANCLYRNNGDGTFTDVTAVADVAGNEWTTSSAFADFSGDGLPDLYVANYSLIDETAAKVCHRSTGEQMACTPGVLTAEFHRLYLNRGDGTFQDITSKSGVRLPNGRGLGLVVWDFMGDGRLGLFVSNDTSANFLYHNTGAGSDGVPTFQEVGILRGVAFDVDGNSQASMGVAAGDINGDGLIDMYITNFFGESDTLYSQRADKQFEDVTRPYQLRDAGFWTLGFGCQFADFDGDGWEDIIATNGHVDQQSRKGDPDRTPPQLFRNIQGRKFDEVLPEQSGAFFQRGYLGRGLAKLDWNRDGRPDFAVSHLHDDFALVTNETPPAGSPLVIRLAGRSGVREPTGALVTLRAGSREMFRLWTAGDGYLVTNERSVQFAVAPDVSTVEVEVRWPGGAIERWGNVRPGQEILLIERQREPVVLHTYAEPSKR